MDCVSSVFFSDVFDRAEPNIEKFRSNFLVRKIFIQIYVMRLMLSHSSMAKLFG